MTVTPTILDWPSLIVPINQLFFAGGEASESLYTVGGVQMLSPEPGGRSFLQLSFNYNRSDEAGRVTSWLMSKASNGNIFRIPIWRSIQVAGTSGSEGTPWSNEQPWSNGENWENDLVATVVGDTLAGSEYVTLEMGALGAILDYGHVIGPSVGGAFMVDEIEYDGTVATIRVSPPLRRAAANGSSFTLRPRMLGYMEDPDSFRAMFEYGKWVRPGNCTLIESIF